MRRVFALGAVFAVLMGAPAFAATTGQLQGTVADAQGNALPGVTVTATSPAQIGGAKVAVTDAEGRFAFPALAPGEYVVSAELQGFASQERNEVQVRLDRTTEMAFTLPEGSVTEEIVVTSEAPVVDPEQVGTAQTFTEEYLQYAAIGSGNRSYQAVLFQAGGVADQGSASNPSVFGSTLGENAYLVDGVDTTDPVTATFGTNFNFDAIQEISFQTGGFEAEYGRATGGVVNIVTKSGGNELAGTLDARYRDSDFYETGDHFDPDTSPVKFQDLAGTLGGPLLRDRLWYFASFEDIDNELTPGGSPTTFNYKGQNYLAKATWQLSPSWQAVVKHSGDPADLDNANADILVAREATRFQEQGGTITQAELSSVLSSSLLWDVKGAVNRQELNSFPQSGDFDTPSHFDLDTSITSGNHNNAQFSERDRDELKTSLTYFLEAAGSHELKGGIEYSDLRFESENYTVTGFQFYDLSSYGQNPFQPQFGAPFVMFVSPNSGPRESTGDLQTVFLQDAWQINDRLTAKLGVRYDQVAFENNVGEEVADMDKLQPRLGFAWDVKGNATSVARASWGRFMHPNALTLPNFARVVSAPTEQWRSCTLYSELFGFPVNQCQALLGSRGFRHDPFGVDPNGWFFRSVTSAAPSTIQPGLEPTYADELILSYEQQLFPRSSLTLTYIDKTTKDIAEDTCIGNLTGTPNPDADCSFFSMDNLPGLKRDYEGAIVSFESRATDWLHLLASYTYSKSRGNVEYTQSAGADFDYFPDHFANTYGYLTDDARNRFKLNGYFLLPLDFSIGFNGTWQSGFAYNRETTPDHSGYGTEYLEPRGSQRGPSLWQLDLQFAKAFAIGPVRASLIAAVLNVTDREGVNEVCENDGGCGHRDDGSDIEWGDATDWQNPRRYEAGFRLEF